MDRSPTVRFSSNQVDHFVEYILSPHITTDLPFGDKSIKMSSGETIKVPNHIRNLIPSRIINQYYQFCQETYSNFFKPLSKTAFYEILNGCSASTRKSLQGLDYFSADGSTAFDHLIRTCDELIAAGKIENSLSPLLCQALLGLSERMIRKLKTDLHSSRNYLKNDYKLHIHNGSTVADHCSVFALSDHSDKDWHKNCDHQHDDRCEQCSRLDQSLELIGSLLKGNGSGYSPVKQKRVLHRIEHKKIGRAHV